MNNGFGINFLRFVREEDGNRWCQVFARLPFDEVELSQKGSLFGLVIGSKNDNWADKEVEITNWVEEYYNGLESVGNISSFYNDFSSNYSEIECLWLWVFVEDGVRKMKIIGKGDVFIVIIRGGENIDLSENIKTGKAILGELRNGDEVRFWLGGIGYDFENWDDALKSEGGSCFAAFKIAAGDFKVEVKEPIVSISEIEKEPVPQETVALEQKVKVFESENLAEDRYVGPVGWKLKIANWLKKKNRVRVVESSSSNTKKNKLSLALGGVFLVLLLISLFFGGLRKKSDALAKSWTEFEQPIEKTLNEAVALSKLNPSGAKKMVEDVRAGVKAKEGEFSEGDYREKIDGLKKRVDDVWVVVSGEKEGAITEVVNLELIRSGVNASRMASFGPKNFVITSSVSGIVMSADVSTKEVKVVAGKGAGLGWIDSVSDGKKFFVMNKGGVFLSGSESVALSFDTAVTDPIGMAKFGANIYVLEKGNKEIFKYTIGDSGFGERTRWLKEDQSVLLVPVDIDIDADIWVLGESGQVEKFRRGVKENFSLTGVSADLKFEKISVEKEGDRLALLSIKFGTVMFCSKTAGSCGQQIKTGKLMEARDIEFDSDGKLMVLLPGAIGVLN